MLAPSLERTSSNWLRHVRSSAHGNVRGKGPCECRLIALSNEYEHGSGGTQEVLEPWAENVFRPLELLCGYRRIGILDTLLPSATSDVEVRR